MDGILDRGKGGAAAGGDWVERGASELADDYRHRAAALLGQRRFAEAEASASASLEDAPENLLAWVVLADAVVQQGRAVDLSAIADGAPPRAQRLLRACAAAPGEFPRRAARARDRCGCAAHRHSFSTGVAKAAP